MSVRAAFPFVLLNLLICLNVRSGAAEVQSTFVYQGHLRTEQAAADAEYDMTFRLYSTATGKSAVSFLLTRSAVMVQQGVFMVMLDFGNAVWNGSDRWLEIGIRPAGTGQAYTVLSPRQPVTPSPYAIFADEARIAQLAASQSITADMLADSLSANLAFLSDDAAFLGNVTAANFLGNGGALSGIHSLDALDGAPVDAVFVDAVGRVGVGTTAPAADLHVQGNSGAGSLLIAPAGVNTNAQIILTENGTASLGMILRYSGGESGNPLHVFGMNREVLYGPHLTIERDSGRVGIANRLQIGTTLNLNSSESGTDGAEILVRDSNGRATINLDSEQTGGGSQITMLNGEGRETVRIDADQADGAVVELRKPDGSVGILLDATNSLGGSLITTDILRITGGADIAEPFDVGPRTLEPGLVVSIDPENPGELSLSREAYDRKVAGVISGAGGVRPGLTLQQDQTLASGQQLVALSGRVYCYCDAADGPIQPGDLLTTSEREGHAMKVTDYARSQGAVLGKAMTPLRSGRGLVLVLVNLN